MPKYSVHATIVGSKFLGEFDAETAEEAERLAVQSDAARMCLCHQCSSQVDGLQVEEASAEIIN